MGGSLSIFASYVHVSVIFMYKQDLLIHGLMFSFDKNIQNRNVIGKGCLSYSEHLVGRY